MPVTLSPDDLTRLSQVLRQWTRDTHAFSQVVPRVCPSCEKVCVTLVYCDCDDRRSTR